MCPAPVIAAAGIGLTGSALAANSQSKAVEGATAAQTASDQAAIEEQRRQFDTIRGLLQPYVDSGTTGLGGLMDLAGIGGTPAVAARDAYTIPGEVIGQESVLVPGTGGYDGGGRDDAWNLYGQQPQYEMRDVYGEDQYMPATEGVAGVSAYDAQQAAIDAIRNGAEYGTMVQSGEDAILANAAATGGLRGGNTQDALSRFRPEVLSQLINQQYGRLSGIANSGQNAAAGLGTAAQNTGNQVSGLLQNSGQVAAQNALASGTIQSNLFGDIANIGGTLAGQWQPGVTNGGLF